MVDVLFAHSYYLKHDSKQLKKMQPFAPLATLYAASLLRQEGYTVTLFDATFADGEEEFEEALRRYRPRFVVLYEDSFHFLIKMCLTRMRQSACRMSAMARDYGATVLAAGPDVSDQPMRYFEAGVQYALVGEAENTLQELMAALTGRQETPVTQIAGLALPDFSAPQGVRRTAPREPERHLDCFPFPAWDLIDKSAYRSAWRSVHDRYSLNMVTTRGCPFHCNWCAKPIWGQRYAMRSPANVAEEMALLKRTIRPDHIWFADDIFGLRGQWVAQFGEEVAARDAVLPFTIQSRVDLMTERTVAGLAQAGCEEVWLGAESGSQRILDAMDKGTRVEQIGIARARLQEAGIRACFFIQFGYPGETFEDIQATVQMVRQTLPDQIGISVSYPLPGTAFHTRVQAQLHGKTHWEDSNDLAMMFQGTYRSSFYRHLHLLLHADLELRQHLQAGRCDADLFAALDRLNTAWMQLGQLEKEQRNALPTRLEPATTVSNPPDLSQEWN